MHKRTILYRGNLKSCNYSCSYCPFAKHRPLTAETEKDRRNFERFCDSVAERAQTFSLGAVLVAPYGEASIHRWYWEGLSRLAQLPGIDRVGMQTNLSFSVGECLDLFDSKSGGEAPAACPSEGNRTVCLPVGQASKACFSGGNRTAVCIPPREKLCIWATFHPEMTTADIFVSKCHELLRNRVMVCAGAVGVPGNIGLIRELREKLSPAVYLWINKMDGLKRNYRPDEIKAFSEIDPFFEYELPNPEAVPAMCSDRCFVEADGKTHTCNISRTKAVNWYDGDEKEIFEPTCSRKRCTCYLAYGGRSDFAIKNVFGEYPVFRVPKQFKAVFLDLDGTLIPPGQGAAEILRPSEGGFDRGRREGGLSARVRGQLTALGKRCPVFLATSMPKEEAKRRLRGDMDLFQGGIFASGGHLCLKDGKGGREVIYPVCAGDLSEAAAFAESAGARLRCYRKKGTVYKITIAKRRYKHWDDKECSRMAGLLGQSGCRLFMEGHCLEIVGKGRDKGAGIKEMCGWLGIPTEDVLAVGNGKEDDFMEPVCGAYIKAGRKEGWI